MTALHNGSIIAEINKGNGATGQGIDMTGTDRQYFVATATTITVQIFHGQASTGSPADSCVTIGNGTVKETCARLTEANTEREVSGVF
jgi:hypothetical protein